jgi:hypothetical protein
MIQPRNLLNFLFYSFLVPSILVLSSCSIYKQQFDCPPPAGIPCASVTEIESMIVETDKGADLIVKPEVEENNHCFWCGAQKPGLSFPSKTSKCNSKVWMCSQKKDGCLKSGHYFQKSDTPDFCSDIVLEPEDIFTCQRN